MLKYLPVFARELEVGTELAVRSNVVVVMCDLCVRYTNTVTRYIPNISACLRDKNPIVREQTLIMLTNLLQVHTQTCNQTFRESFFILLSVLFCILMFCSLTGRICEMERCTVFPLCCCSCGPRPYHCRVRNVTKEKLIMVQFILPFNLIF